MTGVILALVGARRYSDWLLLGSVLLQVACTFPEYEFVVSESGIPRTTHG